MSTSLPDCPEVRGGATRCVRGDELAVGDVLFFLSTPHRISRFEPYVGVLLDNGTLPAGTRIARCGQSWGMTVCPDTRVWVA